MKKFTLMILLLIAGVAFTGSAYSQNLVVNGDLELWDDTQNPTDWDKAENIEQSTTTIHSGTYSAKHTSASGTKDFQQQVEGVTGGSNYTISYYFYDNDDMARARIWAYWMSGDQTLDADEEILRPADYTVDADEWVQWTNTLTAPEGADGFRFEVRVYKQDSQEGGAVFYDDFSIEVAGVNPEPTNYPTDFAAAASGLSVNLSWTDATGENLPSGYLILATQAASKWNVPVDGTAVADDLDLSDGEGVVNVAYGDQAVSFNGLNGGETYDFVIYPYANGGANIDYKTDGTAPEASAQTEAAVLITYNDFNDNSFGTWTDLSVIGAEAWEISPNYGVDDTPCAKMSGYSSAAMDNEDWLISPILNLDMYTNEIFTFYTAKNYNGPTMEVLYSTDYAGNGDDPNNATWNEIDAALSMGDWEWTPSGEIDLTAIEGETVTLAFKYLSTTDGAAAWEVDNIMLLGEHDVNINDIENFNLSIYPNPATDAIVVNAGTKGIAQVLSLTGEVVLESTINSKNTIDISALASGLYMIKFINTSDNTSVIEKIIVR